MQDADGYLKGENQTLRGNEKNEEGSLRKDGKNKKDESKDLHHKQTRHITISYLPSLTSKGFCWKFTPAALAYPLPTALPNLEP